MPQNVLSPATSERSLQVSSAVLNGIRTSIAKLRAGFESGVTRPYEWRAAQLDGLLKMFEQHEARIIEAAHADVGKTQMDAWISEIADTRYPPYTESKKRWLKRLL